MEKVIEEIKAMGMTEDMAIELLRNQHQILTEDYMKLAELERTVKDLGYKFSVEKFIICERRGLVPRHTLRSGKKTYGQRHIYNYLIIMYIVALGFSMEEALIIKSKIVFNPDNVIDLIDIWGRIQSENTKQDNKILKGLAYIAKGRRLVL